MFVTKLVVEPQPPLGTRLGDINMAMDSTEQ